MEGNDYSTVKSGEIKIYVDGSVDWSNYFILSWFQKLSLNRGFFQFFLQ